MNTATASDRGEQRSSPDLDLNLVELLSPSPGTAVSTARPVLR
jgi:hypothetical protein